MEVAVSCLAATLLGAASATGITLPVCEVTERVQKEVSTYPSRVVPIAQVDVTLSAKEGVKRPAVPASAVLQDTQGPYVWVVGQDGKAELVYTAALIQ